MKRSCIPSAEVHNSFLQAAIEFGWPGGVSLLALVCLAGFYLLPLARSDPEARFALCSLVCTMILTIGSGRTSHDGLLFLFLGFAAGLPNFKSSSPIGLLANSAPSCVGGEMEVAVRLLLLSGFG